MNKKVLIFTKTKWDEPPRIRHQFARLLKNNGYKVVFFERNSAVNFGVKYKRAEDIEFISHFELVHPQLRINFLITRINNLFTKFFIKKSSAEINVDFIINFNYDYYFIKELFPDKIIITIINDDFVSLAKWWCRKSALNQFGKTCENSDICLAVSKKLLGMVSNFNKNSALFLPWANKQYSAPDTSSNRSTVLYWGYVNNRVDWDVLKYLLENGIAIRIIGPIAKNVESKIANLSKYCNFSVFSSCKIEEIDFSDVCCSLLSYNLSKSVGESVTISNRGFQLLSFGIPLIYTALPNLLEAPKSVISICSKNEEFLNSVKYFKNNFHNVQSDISIFLQSHYEEDRILQLEKIFLKMALNTSSNKFSRGTVV